MKRSVRGLYAITPEERDTDRLRELVAQAIAGGASAVQYRTKLPDADLRRMQAETLARCCRERGATFIVNDDVDLALAVAADGVHLGRIDLSVRQARALLGEAKVVGASCYDRVDLARDARAAGADYVAFGSVFPSRVKPDAVHAPLDLFARARSELDLPLVAIGGITPANAAAVIAAGADALAVITALFESDDVARTAREFARLFPPAQR